MSLDLYISLSFLTTPRVQAIGSSLRADPYDAAPGWYLRAYRNEGYDDVVKCIRVSDALVEQVAALIDSEIGGKLCPSVQQENASADKAREAQIKRLRDRIAADQKMLASLDGLTNQLSPAKMDSSTAMKEA